MQIGKGKQGVKVSEYGLGEAGNTGDTNSVIGYVEPACDNPQWILWFTNKGDAIFHQKRSATGAVLDESLRVQGQDPKKADRRKR